MAQPDAGELLSRAAAGDEIALRAIMVEHHEDMRRVAAYVVGDSAVAEEAAQAAWVVVWKKLDSVRDPSRLRPWLVSVAVNEAKQLMRSHRRRSQVESAMAASDPSGGVDPATGVALLDLRAALERLSADDRALLAMRYIAGFDSNELATALGISPTGTRARLKRLLDRLRKDLNDG